MYVLVFLVCEKGGQYVYVGEAVVVYMCLVGSEDLAAVQAGH